MLIAAPRKKESNCRAKFAATAGGDPEDAAGLTNSIPGYAVLRHFLQKRAPWVFVGGTIDVRFRTVSGKISGA